MVSFVLRCLDGVIWCCLKQRLHFLNSSVKTLHRNPLSGEVRLICHTPEHLDTTQIFQKPDIFQFLCNNLISSTVSNSPSLTFMQKELTSYDGCLRGVVLEGVGDMLCRIYCDKLFAAFTDMQLVSFKQ